MAIPKNEALDNTLKKKTNTKVLYVGKGEHKNSWIFSEAGAKRLYGEGNYSTEKNPHYVEPAKEKEAK